MYLYFVKNDALAQLVKFKPGATEQLPYLGGNLIHDYELIPHISISDDLDVIAKNKDLPAFFLKATIVTFPKYSTNVYENRRELGVYKLGKAKAELTVGSNSSYCLKIETSVWEGILDMETIQERLWAGTITPTVSYEKIQKKHSLYDLLNEVIGNRKLTPIKRWILASRLMVKAGN